LWKWDEEREWGGLDVCESKEPTSSKLLSPLSISSSEGVFIPRRTRDTNHFLDFRNYTNGTAGAAAIVEALERHHEEIHTLALQDNNFSDKSAASIVASLKQAH